MRLSFEYFGKIILLFKDSFIGFLRGKILMNCFFSINGFFVLFNVIERK